MFGSGQPHQKKRFFGAVFMILSKKRKNKHGYPAFYLELHRFEL
ncbi:MAG: hypothetical protein ACJAWV_003739 [Flammeovirgaceae bacterium]